MYFFAEINVSMFVCVRWLPVRKQYNGPHVDYDIWTELFVLLDNGQLVASLGLLLTALSAGLQLQQGYHLGLKHF